MMELLPQKYILHAALVLMSCSMAFACHGQLLVSGLSAGEKEIIMHEHNKLRQLVATGRYPGQPGAENMREIIWDDELAARAQQWADNCEFRHDPFRTINRFTMGQNLAIIWSTAPLDPTDGDFPSRIQSWFNEVQKYSFGDAWSPKTGHYSQLVWGETSLIGCGFSEYKDATKYNKLYVCNYGPGGNVVGFNPYAVGKPSCATYGLRSSAHYQGLCAPSSAPVVGIATNTIDTYEYKQTINNNKRTAYSTKPATSSLPTNSYTSSSTSSTSHSATSTATSSYYPKQAPTHKKTTISTSAAVTSGGGATHSSYANTAYTAQAGGGHYKYKNKLEAYRPSADEFQRSVRKHTLLRTSQVSNQQQQQQQQQQQPHYHQQQQQQQYAYQPQPQQQQQDTVQDQDIDNPTPEIYYFEEPKDDAQTTAAQSQSQPQTPAKRGWSLLTWRG